MDITQFNILINSPTKLVPTFQPPPTNPYNLGTVDNNYKYLQKSGCGSGWFHGL